MGWKRETIELDEGRRAEAQAPEIVSASRSTDIPAWYADWFFYRLRRGYSAWTNPFNGVKSYVSYSKTRFIVFWSKNPQPLIEHIDYLRERHIGCCVQYTLNDYDYERLESGVPAAGQRVATFRELSRRLGAEGVVWRFDPMILTDEIDMEKLLYKVERLGDALHEYTRKLVFSYADIGSYKKVKKNLERGNIAYREWTEAQMEDFAGRLAALNRRKGWQLEIATCGEKIDIGKYGISHNRCIDGDLIVRRAWNDAPLMKSMGVKIMAAPSPTLFGDVKMPEGAIPLPGNRYFMSVHKKDPGQRLFCGCMAAKDIGEYNTCPHLCEYCYGNASKEAAKNNWERHKHNPYADTITGK